MPLRSWIPCHALIYKLYEMNELYRKFRQTRGVTKRGQSLSRLSDGANRRVRLSRPLFEVTMENALTSYTKCYAMSRLRAVDFVAVTCGSKCWMQSVGVVGVDFETVMAPSDVSCRFVPEAKQRLRDFCVLLCFPLISLLRPRVMAARDVASQKRPSRDAARSRERITWLVPAS